MAVPASPGRWTPQEMLRVRQVGDVQVSSDGGRVLFTVTAAITEDGARWRYVSHIHLADADSPSASALPLTFGDHSAVRPSWSPDGEHICFVSDRQGADDLYLLPLAGGEAQRLTATATGVGNYKWSPDGTLIAFTTKDVGEDAGHLECRGRVVGAGLAMNHLWVVEAGGSSAPTVPTRLTQGDFNVDPVFPEGFNWSPDSKTIAFSHTPTPQQGNRWPVFGDISTVDVASGAVEPLVQTEATSFGPVYSPNGEWLAYAHVERPTWPGIGDLYIVPAAGGDSRRLHATFDRKPLPVGWSAEGDRIYYSDTFRTFERVGALPADGSPPIDLGPQNGVVSRVHLNHTRSHIGCVFEDLENPPEAYALVFGQAVSPEAKRVSSANDQLPDHSLGRTELITWKSRGQEIEGLLTYPVDYTPGNACPLIVDLHGGPHWFFSQVFGANPQPYQFPLAVFAASGYAVLRCNIRGSGGYGPEFRFAIMEDLGGVDFDDVMAGVDHVIDLGVADPERLGVLGWSYGGYLAAWTITQTHRFKAACMLAPVANLVSFTGTTDNHELFPGYFKIEFWDDAELFVTRSPVMQAGGVATPALFLHGEADTRVPISQSREMYDALRQQGCETQMVTYPGMEHVPADAGQLLDIMERSLGWFDRFL